MTTVCNETEEVIKQEKTTLIAVLSNIETSLNQLKTNMGNINSEITNMKTKIRSIKKEISIIRSEVGELIKLEIKSNLKKLEIILKEWNMIVGLYDDYNMK